MREVRLSYVLVAVVAAVVVIAVVSQVVAMNSMLIRTKEEVAKQVTNLLVSNVEAKAKSLKDKLASWIDIREEVIKLTAKRLSEHVIKEGSKFYIPKDELIKVLSDAKSSNEVLAAVAKLVNGYEYSTSPNVVNALSTSSCSKWFLGAKEALNKGLPYWFESCYLSKLGKAVSILSAPIVVNDTFVGAIAVVIDLTPLEDIILQVKVGKYGYAYVLSTDGVTLAHPSKSLLGVNVLSIKDLSSSFKEIFEKAVKEGQAKGWYVYKGVKGYATLHRVQGTRLGLRC